MSEFGHIFRISKGHSYVFYVNGLLTTFLHFSSDSYSSVPLNSKDFSLIKNEYILFGSDNPILPF